MTRASLSRALGYKTQSAISQWERGNSPDFRTISKISEILDIPISALFDDPYDDRVVERVPREAPEIERIRQLAAEMGLVIRIGPPQPQPPKNRRRPRPKK